MSQKTTAQASVHPSWRRSLPPLAAGVLKVRRLRCQLRPVRGAAG